MSFVNELPQKKYVPNIVIEIASRFYTIRQPDSGLSGPSVFNGFVSSLTLNPTSIDPLRPANVISQSAFKLLDKNGQVTDLFDSLSGNTLFLQNEPVQIYLGRSFVGMDFADYFRVPLTFVSKVSRGDNVYTFSTKDAKDVLATGAFSIENKLAVNILAGTTIITLQDSASFPSSGIFKVGSEFISYTGKSGNNLTGCIRGVLGTSASTHNAGTSVFLTQVVTGNPITLLLQLLISSGGGGIYDVLPDGSGIDESLIDLVEFEAIKDSIFAGYQFRLFLQNIENLRAYVENEILYPLGLRLRTNNNGLIGLAVLGSPTLNIDGVTIDHDQMTDEPDWSVDDTKVLNRIVIEWDYNDATDRFEKITEFEDSASILEYGPRNPLRLRFKGIKSSLGGQSIVDKIGATFLARFSIPRPLVQVATHFAASAWLLGERPDVESQLIPASDGSLNFADSLEVLSKSINYENGQVRFTLSFNQFTGIKTCFLAPCDTIQTVNSQSEIVVSAGMGSNYRVGWRMRIRDALGTSTETRTISAISGDTITFSAAFVYTITPGATLIFPDFADATEQQKKYCYLAPCNDNPFPDGTKPYQVTFC